MSRFVSILLLMVFLSPAFSQQPDSTPDLTKKQDLADLGTGKIIEKDRSIYKDIILREIKPYSIVYEKNGSLHDMPIDDIKRIEFPDSKWGSVKIEFNDYKPSVSYNYEHIK